MKRALPRSLRPKIPRIEGVIFCKYLADRQIKFFTRRWGGGGTYFGDALTPKFRLVPQLFRFLPDESKKGLLQVTFLCVFFIPPLYFLTRKKWGGFIINSIFYGIACALVLTLALIFVAPLFWLIAVFHAGYYWKQERRVQDAELLATKMAEKMREVPKA